VPRNNQITGNTGLFYVCYQLSKLGWNVLPTSRNAKGADLIIYDRDQERRHTIQVKTLTKDNYIHGIGEPFSDFLVICNNIGADPPETYSAARELYQKALEKETAKGFKGYFLRPTKFKQFGKGLQSIGRG
jgi:hypothetical protein